jgi:ribosomal protein L19E
MPAKGSEAGSKLTLSEKLAQKHAERTGKAPQRPNPSAASSTGEPPEGPAAARVARTRRAPDRQEAPQESPAAAAEAGVTAPAGQVDDQPKFTPNFKFKAYGKEYEIPEQFRGLIKDEQTQKELHDLFSSAKGIEHLKPHYEKVRTEHQQLVQQHTNLVKQIQPINEAIKRKDVQSLVDMGVLDEQTLLQYGVARAKYYQAPAEQRQVFDERHQAQRQARELQNQQQTSQERYLDELANARSQLLDFELTKPDVAPIVQVYESAPGQQPGAFKEAVRQYAHAQYLTTGRDLSPQEAAREFLNQFRAFMPQPAAVPGANTMQPMMGHPPAGAHVYPGNVNPGYPTQPQAPNPYQVHGQYPAPQAMTPPPPVPQPPVKVLPNIQAQNASPTKQIPRNLKELRDLAAQKAKTSRGGR